MSSLIPYRRHNHMMHPFMSNEMEETFFRPFLEMSDFFGASSFRVDVKEKKDHYLLEAELPGVPEDQISLTVDDGILTIEADMNSEKKEEKENYLYSERRIGHFQRSFNMEGVKEEEITAKYKNGVLQVVLPKKEQKKDMPEKRRIPID